MSTATMFARRADCSARRRCSAISKPAQPRRISPASAPAGWKALRQVRFHLNLLRDLKRINAHVASAAYPILEKRGELLSSRLRQET